MKATEIKKVLDNLASPELAYEGEELGYVVGGGDKDVSVLAVTERPTVDVLQEAVDKNVDMLVIHEPLYHSEKAFLIDKSSLSFPPNRKREELIKKGGFAIFRYHSQWDDVLISGDITDGRARFAQELGLAVIDAGDYWTENPGAKRLVNILRKKLSSIKVLHLDPGKPWVLV